MSPPNESCLLAVGYVAYAEDPGEALLWWRRHHEVTQAAVAEAMGVSPSVVSDYENGVRSTPGVDFAARYVSAVYEVANGRQDLVEETVTDVADRYLRGQPEKWESVPSRIPDDISDTIRAVWDGFESG